jgi:O-antigen/teichoic acid export membrane protein
MRKSLMAGMGGYLTIIITTLQTIIITRQLSPADVGTYAAFRQFCLLGAQIVTFGIPSGLIYFISVKNKPVNELLTTNILFHVFCTTGYLMALLLFQGQIGEILKVSLPGGVLIPLLYTLFVGIRNYFYNALIAGLQVRRTVLIDILPISVSFVCLLTLIFFKCFGLSMLLIFDLVATPLLGGLVGFYFLMQSNNGLLTARPNTELFFSQASHGFWMNLSDVLILLQFYLVYHIVGHRSANASEVGFYARAFSIINIFITSLMFMVRYFYASWATLDLQAKKMNLARVISVSAIFSIVAALIVGTFSQPIVILLFGKTFLPSAHYLNILIAAIPANIIYLLIASFNNSEGKVKLNVIQLGGSVGIFYILAELPFSNMGLSGIAYAYLIATCLLSLVAFIVLTLSYKMNMGYYTGQFRILLQRN